MAKVLIVGCGDVGSRLALTLAAAGHEVFGLRRTAATLAGVTMLQGDVTQAATLKFPSGLDYGFIVLAPGESGAEAYRRIYFEGTRQVLQALARQCLRRLFWVSSSSVYGQDAGEWVDEDSPAQPASATAQVLLKSEALVQAAAWPATVLRLSGLYGPGRLRLLNWVKAGWPVQAQPLQWSNRLHVADAAGALAFLLERDQAGVNLAPLYIGTDRLPVPQHEVLDWLAQQMELPAVPHEARPGAGSNKRLSNKRLLELGYRLQYPDFRAGYADVLASARDA